MRASGDLALHTGDESPGGGHGASTSAPVGQGEHSRADPGNLAGDLAHRRVVAAHLGRGQARGGAARKLAPEDLPSPAVRRAAA